VEREEAGEHAQRLRRAHGEAPDQERHDDGEEYEGREPRQHHRVARTSFARRRSLLGGGPLQRRGLGRDLALRAAGAQNVALAEHEMTLGAPAKSPEPAR
jgi:hypothetical protein